MACRQTYRETSEQARYPAGRAQRSGSFGNAPCFPTRGGRIGGQAETDAERASEQDSGISEANTGICQDATPAAGFSEHLVPRHGVQSTALGEAAGIAPISRFVRRLKKDWSAVEKRGEAGVEQWLDGRPQSID